jgi:copper chaperone
LYATAKVEVDTKTKIVKIQTQKSPAEIKQAIATASYPAA